MYVPICTYIRMCMCVHTYVVVYVCIYVLCMYVQLSAAGVSKLAKHCQCLEVLNITKCFNVDDQAIQDVLQVSSILIHLHKPTLHFK